jgi:hypothetical protein
MSPVFCRRRRYAAPRGDVPADGEEAWAETTVARKHHYVPQMYLAGFTNDRTNASLLTPRGASRSPPRQRILCVRHVERHPERMHEVFVELL